MDAEIGIKVAFPKGYSKGSNENYTSIYLLDANYYFEDTGTLEVSLAYKDGDVGYMWMGAYNYVEVYTEAPTSPVPEPATMLLLSTGLVGLAGLGRKKFLKK